MHGTWSLPDFGTLAILGTIDIKPQAYVLFEYLEQSTSKIILIGFFL
jgi:hypothetical protein